MHPLVHPASLSSIFGGIYIFIFFYLIFAGTNDCVTLCCGHLHPMSHTTMTSICGVSTSYGISGSWASQAAAKLACQRSPVNGLRPKLHRSRQPISRATTRKVITMGLPIPIIGESLLCHNVCSLDFASYSLLQATCICRSFVQSCICSACICTRGCKVSTCLICVAWSQVLLSETRYLAGFGQISTRQALTVVRKQS